MKSKRRKPIAGLKLARTGSDWWRHYINEQRAARRLGMSMETPGQYRQRTVPPKKGNGSYVRRPRTGGV